MSNLVVIDSSVLVAYILPQDSNNLSARRVIGELFVVKGDYRVIIPPLALYETGVVVTSFGYNPDILAQRLHKLINLDNVTSIALTETAVFKHLRLTDRKEARQPLLRTHDLLIVATALDFQAQIASFDHQMINCCQRISVEKFTLPESTTGDD